MGLRPYLRGTPHLSARTPDTDAPELAVESVTPVLAGAGSVHTEPHGPAPVETSPRSTWTRVAIAAVSGAGIVEAMHAMGVL